MTPCDKEGSPNSDTKISLFLSRHNISLVSVEHSGMPKLEMQWKVKDCTQCYHLSPKSMIIAIKSDHEMGNTFTTNSKLIGIMSPLII